MSDDEDVPQAALFFSRRAAFVPHVSAEEFESVTRLLNENRNDSKERKKGPPPSKRGKTGSAAKKYTPEPEEILVEEKGELVPPSPKVVLSAATKRRLKKQQDQRADEMRKIEAANEIVLSAANSSSLNEIDEIYTCENNAENNVHTILTIAYMSEISRLRCFEHEKFSVIFPRVANLFNLKASEILLCLKEKNINVDDTPKSLNITFNDTIECIPYVAAEDTNEDNEDALKIVFQSNDSKEKIDLLVHKLEKMQDIMMRYSTKRSIPLDKLSFEFDGEKIEGTETPEDLDMESGNCIDVKVVTSSPKKSLTKRPPPASVITVDDDSSTDLVVSDDDCSVSSDIQVLSVTPGYMGVASNVTVTTDATRSPRGRGRGRGRGSGRGRGRRASNRSRRAIPGNYIPGNYIPGNYCVIS